MKTCKFKQESGFSLIELMIAVTVIGILSVIGMNQYNKHYIRSQQAMAKSHLMQLFSAEKVFHTHHFQYFGDWRNLGFNVEGEIYYRIGFSTGAGGPLCPASYRGPGVAPGQPAVNINSTFCVSSGECVEHENLRCDLTSACGWNTNTFLACASGRTEEYMSNGTDTRILMTIDEGKSIRLQTIGGC